MANRYLSSVPLAPHHALDGLILASPRRRVLAFLIDVLLLLVPSLLVTIGAVLLSLLIAERPALRALADTLDEPAGSREELVERQAELAGPLVRAGARGLPPELQLAVREGDRESAARILSEKSITVSLSLGQESVPPPEDEIVLELRSAATFGVAALYFVFFTSGSRRATPGKALLRVEVFRLDGRPLTRWEAFEPFGGYLASLGTVGLGLIEFWRDPNRRLAHDRIAHTVVLRRSRHA